MLKKIEQLRKEPKEVRNRYAFWVSFLFTAVVAVFWASSLPARITVFTGVVPEKETQGAFGRVWQDMTASVSKGFPRFQDVPATEDSTATEEGGTNENQVQTETWQEFVTGREIEHTGDANPILISTSSGAEATSIDE